MMDGKTGSFPYQRSESLLGLPIVEVDDMDEGEIRLGPPMGVMPVSVRLAVASSPTDPLRFVMEVKSGPGLYTMEEMRDG